MRARPPEEWCWQTLRKLRWSAGVLCPCCTAKAGRHHRKRNTCYYRCRGCRRMFSDLTATPFEQTRALLSAWFLAISLFSPDSEEQPTAFELARILKVDFKTAARIRNRLLAFRQDPLICSIRTDMFLWKVKNRKENRPLVRLQRDFPGEVALLEIGVANSHGENLPPQSPIKKVQV